MSFMFIWYILCIFKTLPRLILSIRCIGVLISGMKPAHMSTSRQCYLGFGPWKSKVESIFPSAGNHDNCPKGLLCGRVSKNHVCPSVCLYVCTLCVAIKNDQVSKRQNVSIKGKWLKRRSKKGTRLTVWSRVFEMSMKSLELIVIEEEWRISIETWKTLIERHTIGTSGDYAPHVLSSKNYVQNLIKM